MNSTKTITIGDKLHPVALSRSSIKVIRSTSQNDCDLRVSNQKIAGTNQQQQLRQQNYANIEPQNWVSQQSSKININRSSLDENLQSKHIKLVIASKNETNLNLNSSIEVSPEIEPESYLSTLIDEYQSLLKRKDCDNTSCYRFKLISYRITQALFERINVLKDNLETAKKISHSPSRLPQRQASFQSSSHPSDQTRISELEKMEKDSLLDVVVEKNRRIQDLERLVEEQRRLRLQDASQVEEKAARIKEWVANKLKELENQNKQLRDQNKKQKEVVESLSTKLASISPISSPRRLNQTTDSIHFIDQVSPIDTIDVNESLKARKPQLKKTFQMVSSSSEDENQNSRSQLKLNIGQTFSNESRFSSQYNSRLGLGQVSKSGSSSSSETNRIESPVYDSVTFEMVHKKANEAQKPLSPNKTSSGHERSKDNYPPQPPLHQSEKWELQLYNLADQSLSSIMKPSRDERWNECSNEPESLDSNSNFDKWASISRKSSSSVKNDLFSIVRPSFTTIDGDQVIDCFNFDDDCDGRLSTGKSSLIESSHHRGSNDQSSDSSLRQLKPRKDSSDSFDNIEKAPLTPSLFDSPMRSRSGKDSILRTQSVRRTPAPERLYDFISADLIKRGYLTKPGALKNHHRWFVLKNFHLCSYKNELDETAKAVPNMKLKLESSCQIQLVNQTSESNFPFKIIYPDKTINLVADKPQVREEWVRILTQAISMSDIEPESLAKHKSTFEGIVSVTRHGHTKRYYATLVDHILFFLKSVTDPTPIGYVPIKGSRIREFTDSYDYDFEEQEELKHKNNLQDCSLAIYPRFSMSPDPVYLALGSQQDTDKWFYYLSAASGIDQSHGTKFERTLAKIMVHNSMIGKDIGVHTINKSAGFEGVSGCIWKEHPVMLYSDTPINQPLTSLPNETLRVEAIELFKSILLFTQVPLEPVAIDYHVSLLQNCFARFLKYPELRNEFYAQLIKQCTYIFHRCKSQNFTNDNNDPSSTDPRSSLDSSSSNISECRFITDPQQLDMIIDAHGFGNETTSQISLQSSGAKNKTDQTILEAKVPPSQSELLQVVQMLAISVSLNLPRGRIKWWLMDHLRKFSNPTTNIGKYALYTLKAIDRTVKNGTRDNVPSRMEIMSILLRNPHDHSSPHSLPVSFPDGSYLVLEADGSTTIDELMNSMARHVNIRHSMVSDFYLFADDPSGSKDLHILEPQRKVLDIVGWWEQTLRRLNSGRYQSARVIKLMCKKRLILRAETDETLNERLLIVHQIHQEVLSRKVPLSESLTIELSAIMAQINYGDSDKAKDPKLVRCMLEKLAVNLSPNDKSNKPGGDSRGPCLGSDLDNQLIDRWQHLTGKSAQDCVRVYLNCIRRLQLDT